MIRALGLTFLISSALFVSAGCSELAGTGELVAIPPVTFTCSTGNCTGAAPNDEFRVYYSEFGCTGSGQQTFFAVRSATGQNLACGGASCTGTANSWLDNNKLPSAQIPEGTYDVCVVLFRQGSIVAGPTAQDAYAYELRVPVTRSSTSINITSFNSGAAPLY